MKYLLILLFSTTCLASSQDDLINHIKVRCQWNNSQIPLDVREDCMTDYVNSAVVDSGEIDLKQVTKKRLEEAKDRRLENE